MDKSRIVTYVEASFLAPLLAKDTITDISWNGEALFYEDRAQGRKKAKIPVTNMQVGDFLRQISNYAEAQFTYLNPILDVSFGRYRLNADFFSIVRMRDEKAFSFCLRIGHPGSVVGEDPDFFPGKTKRLLFEALSRRETIVIAGETGSGKTELQKYLLMNLPSATRVIAIDNVEELELCREEEGTLDFTSWHVDDRNPRASFSALIQNALRNNPDYLLVAEIRGEEMYAALQALMSGNPMITTTHAASMALIPHRLARLAQTGGTNLVYEDLLGDINKHVSLLVYLKKETKNNRVHRYIQEIGRLLPSGEIITLFSLKHAQEEL
ncbi:MAG: type II/IV secretion system ATPase subunit [Bacilli bacterium]|nr:type II/IV secretion system ATPase subunit [Bacilli bacterium]